MTDVDKVKKIVEMIPPDENYIIVMDGYTFRLHNIETYFDFHSHQNNCNFSQLSDAVMIGKLQELTGNFLQWSNAIKEQRIPPWGGKVITSIHDFERLIRMNVDDFSLDALILRIEMLQL